MNGYCFIPLKACPTGWAFLCPNVKIHSIHCNTAKLEYIWGMENNNVHTNKAAERALQFTSWTPEQLDVINRIAADGHIEMTTAEMNAFDNAGRTGDGKYSVTLQCRRRRNTRTAKRDIYLMPLDESEAKPPVIIMTSEARRIIKAFESMETEDVEFNVDNENRADVHEMIADHAPETIYSYASNEAFTTFKLIK